MQLEEKHAFQVAWQRREIGVLGSILVTFVAAALIFAVASWQCSCNVALIWPCTAFTSAILFHSSR